MDRPVCNCPIDKLEYLGAQLVGILLIRRKVALRVGRSWPVV
jgi:hypothetical protein